MAPNPDLENLKARKASLLEQIGHEKKKRENIKMKIELMRRKHEMLASVIQLIKRDIDEITSKSIKIKQEAIENEGKNGRNSIENVPKSVENIAKCSKSIPNDIENTANNTEHPPATQNGTVNSPKIPKIVIKDMPKNKYCKRLRNGQPSTSTHSIDDDSKEKIIKESPDGKLKMKMKMRSTIIKLFKRIVGKNIKITKCRRLNKMNCRIWLDTALKETEKVILVDTQNPLKVNLKIIKSSKEMLQFNKNRKYYYIKYLKLESKKVTYVIDDDFEEDDDDEQPDSKIQVTKADDSAMIVLNPVPFDSYPEENKFFISRLGERIIEEYFYFISSDPFEIRPIYGDVILSGEMFDSLKPIIIENMKNKVPNMIPYIQIVNEEHLNEIEKDVRLGVEKMAAINSSKQTPQTEITSNKNIVDLTATSSKNIPPSNSATNNNSSDDSTNRTSFLKIANVCSVNKQINSPKKPTNTQPAKIAENNIAKKTNSSEPEFVRSSLKSMDSLKSVKVREYVKWDSNNCSDQSKTITISRGSKTILLDSDDDLEETS